MTERKIAVFCSASAGIDDKFNEAAREVIHALHSLGYTVVSGGTVKSTMKVIVDASAECGGKHVGVIPRFMAPVLNPKLSEVIWTDTMSERKEKMREGTVGAIALPGGIGTLDEIIETLVLAKLDRYHGRLCCLNLDGFFDPFISLLDHYLATGMLDAPSRALLRFPTSVDELISYYKNQY